MESKERLGRMTVGLHWIVGAGVIFLLWSGFYMASTEAWSLYPLHKSIGVILLAVALARAFRRWRHGWPQPVSTYSSVERALSILTHWILLVSTITMPVTGMLHSGASGHGFGIFGIDIVHSHHREPDLTLVVPHSAALAAYSAQAHEIIAYVLAAAIALHLAGALKHHLLDRDNTLRRMLGLGAAAGKVSPGPAHSEDFRK